MAHCTWGNQQHTLPSSVDAVPCVHTRRERPGMGKQANGDGQAAYLTAAAGLFTGADGGTRWEGIVARHAPGPDPG